MATFDVPALARQFRTFFGVGLLAAVVHYGLLLSLVEGYRMDPVPATLTGYVCGGVVSYLLNRRLTYRSARPHGEATWRFIVVSAVGFGLTWLAVSALVRGLGVPYLPAQLVTTGLVLFWNFSAHKLWTFRGPPVP
ncbi:GtrA family protein [Enterovirga sp.]|uniref:GtrA family protein n=1 Tax=Enterovirga sp. TaxID=2026350 RepID=UPI0026171275|nr:GtrA family protein [Enterovirga sp.]MDB5592798.1 GtrA family protein [Enterovirga sp.]